MYVFIYAMRILTWHPSEHQIENIHHCWVDRDDSYLLNEMIASTWLISPKNRFHFCFYFIWFFILVLCSIFLVAMIWIPRKRKWKKKKKKSTDGDPPQSDISHEPVAIYFNQWKGDCPFEKKKLNQLFAFENSCPLNKRKSNFQQQ